MDNLTPTLAVQEKSEASLSNISTSDLDPVDEFLSGQLSDRTRRAYEADLRHFFQFTGVDANLNLSILQNINHSHVISFRNHLAERDYKHTSINRKLSSLKAFFKMLLATGKIEKNPTDSALVRGYKIEANLTGKAIPKSALNGIIAQIEVLEDPLMKARDMALFFVLMYGGLRRSEAAKMSWEHLIENDEHTLLLLPDTKSGTDQLIKMQPVVLSKLFNYKKELELHDHPCLSSAPIFISLARNNSHGKQLTAQSVNLIVKRHARAAGVSQKITAHMFRHTCCTLAIEGGARPQQVQSQLRHKDIKTTMKYYEDRNQITDNASDYIQSV